MPDDRREGAEASRGRTRRRGSKPNMQLVTAAGVFLLVALAMLGAFLSGRGFETSVDGLTKIQIKIFEKSRVEAIKDVPRTVPDAIPDDLRARIRRNAGQLVGAYVLWVDDGGALQNSWERRALSALGVAIDTASSTDEALDLLDSGLAYDVLITDLSRPGDIGAPCYPGSTRFVSAGCRLIQAASALCGDRLPPIIIYAAGIDEDAGQPSRTIGMTNRFDRLAGLVLDGLERRPAADEPGYAGPCARNALRSGA